MDTRPNEDLFSKVARMAVSERPCPAVLVAAADVPAAMDEREIQEDWIRTIKVARVAVVPRGRGIHVNLGALGGRLHGRGFLRIGHDLPAAIRLSARSAVALLAPASDGDLRYEFPAGLAPGGFERLDRDHSSGVARVGIHPLGGLVARVVLQSVMHRVGHRQPTRPFEQH
jgi:hypothetical protein